MIYLIFGLVGHILCGICDCLLSYSRKGRLDFKNIKDQKKMSEMFEDMPLGYPLVSVVLGTFAIMIFGFSYFYLASWMKPFSPASSLVMSISALVFLVPITTHHVICGFVEWFYVRMGRTSEVRSAVFEFQKKTGLTMIIGYLGLAIFLITLFVNVVTGKTDLPQWACLFNTLPIMLILTPTKLPAKGNIAGALMYLGLLFFVG